MEQFWKDARELVPDSRDKEAALAVISRAVQEKNIGYSPSLWEILWTELRYISPYFWILQGAIAAAVYMLIKITAENSGGLAECLRWGSVAAALMGMLICGGLEKHFSAGMAELEVGLYDVADEISGKV